MSVYCTYFDHRYLSRGLAMHRSLRAVAAAETYVLCLDQLCLEMLQALREPGIHPLPLQELERWAPELAALRPTRSLIEFYFTLTPFVTRYVAENLVPEGESVTYVDSDLFFFADPRPVFEEMRGASIGIIGHKFPPEIRDRECFGKYNVGFLSFRHDANGLRCLRWWSDRCAEWCHDRLEADRFADQKYLDRWPELFEGVREIQHKGANVAPWNIANYSVTQNERSVRVDGMDLLFYHFHDLKRLLPFVLDSRLRYYAAALVPPLRRLIYVPYVRVLAGIEREVAIRAPSATASVPLVRHEGARRSRWSWEPTKELLSAAKRGDCLYLLRSQVV